MFVVPIPTTPFPRHPVFPVHPILAMAAWNMTVVSAMTIIPRSLAVRNLPAD